MNAWTLYKTKPFPNFPSETYLILEDGIVKYQREQADLGCIPVNLENCVGNTIKEVRESFPTLVYKSYLSIISWDDSEQVMNLYIGEFFYDALEVFESHTKEDEE